MSRLSPLLALLLITGCSHHVYSPPARLISLQSPATVGADTIAVAGEVVGAQGLFGPDMLGASGRVRYGLGSALEVGGEVNVVGIDDGNNEVDTHPFVYAGRAAVKWAPAAVADFFAVTGGVGGGWSAGGGFFSPDLGVVAGYENRYLVPFVSLEGVLSVPIDPQPVDTSAVDDEPGTHVDTPALSYGARASLGVRVPVSLGNGTPASLYLAYGHLHLWDADGEDGYGGFAAGFEASF